jgi:SlyX protein
MVEDTRLEALESRLAHLEQGQQELSDALYRQQRELDALRLRNQQLLAETEGGASSTSLTSDERPPHY